MGVKVSVDAATSAGWIHNDLCHPRSDRNTDFADEVVVMYEGQIVQIGTQEELFSKPRPTFVGHFIGSLGMNLLPC